MLRFNATSIYDLEHDCRTSKKPWSKRKDKNDGLKLIEKQLENEGELNDTDDFKSLENLDFEIKPDLKKALQEDIKKIKQNIDIQKAGEAYQNGNLNDFYTAVGFQDGENEGFTNTEKAMIAALILAALRSKPLFSKAVEDAVKPRPNAFFDPFAGLKPSVLFSPQSKTIQDYIRNYTGQKIGYIGATTRQGVQSIFINALENNHSPDKIKADLRNIIGLSPRQIKAYQNREAQLIANGFNGKRLKDALNAFSEKQLNYRIEMIARTEASFIKNQGQVMLLKENIDLNNVAGKVPHKKWVTFPWDRVCSICMPLDGKTIPLNAFFDGIYDSSPAHPNCHCTTLIVYLEPKIEG